MSFRKLFPATCATWRFVSSRKFLYAAGIPIATVLLFAVVIRVPAFLFAIRAHHLLSQYNDLRLGEPVEEALAAVPSLKQDPSVEQCPSDVECYGTGARTELLLRALAPSESGLEKAIRLYKVGLRASNIGLRVQAKSGKVVGFQCTLTDQNPDLYEGGNMDFGISRIAPENYGTSPGRLTVGIEIELASSAWAAVSAANSDESPDLAVAVGRSRRPKQVRVVTDERSSPAQRRLATSLNLKCLWLFGCSGVDQMMPAALDYRREVRAKYVERVQSNDPCPSRVLSSRVRHQLQIWRGTVSRVEHHPDEPSGVSKVQFKVTEKFRDRWNELHTPWPEFWIRDRNPVRSVLQVNADVIVMGDTGEDDNPYDPCAIIPATPENLRVLREELELVRAFSTEND